MNRIALYLLLALVTLLCAGIGLAVAALTYNRMAGGLVFLAAEVMMVLCMRSIHLQKE